MRRLTPFAALLLTGALGTALAASAVASWTNGPGPQPNEAAPSPASLPANPNKAAVAPPSPAPEEMLNRYQDALAKRSQGASAAFLDDPAFKKAAEVLRDQALAQAYIEQHRTELLQGTEVSEEELRKAYEEHRSEYVSAPTFTAHHLLVYRKGNPAFADKGIPDEKARARAEDARRRLLAGESWDSVAQKLSDDLNTRDHGGLMRDSSWGHLPRSVEDAMRKLELRVPSHVIESEFGYHLVQVESRTTEPTPLPFEQVRQGLLETLSNDRQASAGRRHLEPLYAETHATRTEAGWSEAHLALAARSFAPDTVLATVAQRPVTEADLQAFIESTVPPSQRPLVFARPHARQTVLTSYLDVLVLSELARRGGLEEVPAFQAGILDALSDLLASFAQRPDEQKP